MNGYVIGVIGTVLLCALFTAITPEGKTSAVIKGIARLVCVLTIISPVLRFFSGGSFDVFFDKDKEENFQQTSIETDEAFIQYYSEMRIRNAEHLLEKTIEEKFAFDVDVAFSWSVEQEIFGDIYSTEYIKIECIHIGVPKEVGEEVRNEMRLYVTENYDSEVYIE